MNNYFIRYNPQEKKYDVNAQSIEEFLSVRMRITIPKYQRPYSWEKRNLEELISDIENSTNLKKNWFIGPVFTSESNSSQGNSKELELLDGQQRLTSIFIILRTFCMLQYLDKNYPNNLLPTDNTYRQKEERKMKNIQNTIQDLILLSVKNDEYEEEFESKFFTDENIKLSFNTFLEQITRRWDTDKLNYTNYYKHYSNLPVMENSFNPTIKTINKNIQIVEDYFKEKLNEEYGLEFLNNFIDSLLKKFILVHIPLNDGKGILDIFETINSRGKHLNLVDKLRFSCLKEVSTNKENYQREAGVWNKIYKNSDWLVQKGIIPSLDAFVDRFINSIALSPQSYDSDSLDGYTNDLERQDRFNEFYKEKKGNITIGSSEISDVLERMVFLFDRENGLMSYAKNNTFKEKISSILILLENLIKFIQQGQLILIAYLRTSYNHPQKNEDNSIGSITYNLVEIIKSVFCIGIYNRISGNASRGMFIEIAGSYEKSLKLTYKNFNTTPVYTSEEEGQEEKTKTKFPLEKIHDNEEGLMNLIFVKRGEQKRAEIILGMYQLLKDDTNFPEKNFFESSHIDHIVPEKWSQNKCWKENLKHETLTKSIQNLPDGLVKNHLMKKLNDTEKPFWSDTKYADTFVQLIGNKVHLKDKQNMDVSNNYWNDCTGNGGNNYHGSKLEYLKSKASGSGVNQTRLLPTHPRTIYEYEKFGIEEIIERTYDLGETFLSDFDDYICTLQ